jgi:hypothetical protein
MTPKDFMTWLDGFAAGAGLSPAQLKTLREKMTQVNTAQLHTGPTFPAWQPSMPFGPAIARINDNDLGPGYVAAAQINAARIAKDKS